MESDDTDSGEKKNTLPEIRSAADLAREKERGKRPMEAKKQKQSKTVPPAIDEVELRRQRMKDSPIKDEIELITQKAKGITIKDTATSAAKRGMGGWRDNVITSQYSLRSGDGVRDLYVGSTKANKKRKERAKSSEVYEGLEADTEEACKRLKGRERDDDKDKDGAGAGNGGRTTRSSSRKRRVQSV